MTGLDDALGLLPEAWAGDIADDAAAQRCRVGYTTASGGLRTETIERVQRRFAEREDDADWLDMSLGQQLDECFRLVWKYVVAFEPGGS